MVLQPHQVCHGILSHKVSSRSRLRSLSPPISPVTGKGHYRGRARRRSLDRGVEPVVVAEQGVELVVDMSMSLIIQQAPDRTAPNFDRLWKVKPLLDTPLKTMC